MFACLFKIRAGSEFRNTTLIVAVIRINVHFFLSVAYYNCVGFVLFLFFFETLLLLLKSAFHLLLQSLFLYAYLHTPCLIKTEDPVIHLACTKSVCDSFRNADVKRPCDTVPLFHLEVQICYF